jgi:fido (protein-threonine AMPylation protein)
VRLKPDLDALEESFKYAKRVGVKPQIRDAIDYGLAFEAGLTLADRLAKSLDLVPTPVEIRATHCAIFKNIHPWAGELRQPGSKIWVVGLPGDPPEKLESRLKDLCEWAKEDFAWAEGHIERQAYAIASFHVALKRIQAFGDGSGRTAGVLLEHQVQKCFGLPLEERLAQDYDGGLLKGLQDKNVAELATSLLRALNLTHADEEHQSAAGQGHKAVLEGHHVFVHERLEKFRIEEPLRVIGPHEQWFPLQSKYDEKLEIEVALEDLKQNPLEPTASEKTNEAIRLSGKRERDAASEERSSKLTKETEEMAKRAQEEQESHSRSERESHSHGYSH